MNKDNFFIKTDKLRTPLSGPIPKKNTMGDYIRRLVRGTTYKHDRNSNRLHF